MNVYSALPTATHNVSIVIWYAFHTNLAIIVYLLVLFHIESMNVLLLVLPTAPQLHVLEAHMNCTGDSHGLLASLAHMRSICRIHIRVV